MTKLAITMAEIKAQAQELLSSIIGDLRYPVPVISIAESLGYEVYEIPASEASGKVDHDKKIIYIKGSESIQRKRFTIAHEIGHIVLHKGKDFHYRNGSNDLSFSSDYTEEIEANRFAAALLMPEEEFRRVWQEALKSKKKWEAYIKFGAVWQEAQNYTSPVEFVATYFNASITATTIRANQLGLV